MNISELQHKWTQNADFYCETEVGSGVHSFVKDVFTSPELLYLRETARKTGKFGTFTHDTEKKKVCLTEEF